MCLFEHSGDGGREVQETYWGGGASYKSLGTRAIYKEHNEVYRAVQTQFMHTCTYPFTHMRAQRCIITGNLVYRDMTSYILACLQAEK
jgi:hypothetical protein